MRLTVRQFREFAMVPLRVPGYRLGLLDVTIPSYGMIGFVRSVFVPLARILMYALAIGLTVQVLVLIVRVPAKD